MQDELITKVEKIMIETNSKRDGAIIRLVSEMSADDQKAIANKFDLDYNPAELWTLRDAVEGIIISWFVKRDRLAQMAARSQK